MNKFKLVLLSLFIVGGLAAQDLSKLTPEQLEMYKKYMAGKSSITAGTTSDVKTEVQNRTVDANDSTLLTPERKRNSSAKLTIFGSYLFNNQKLTFEPKLNIPTPQNYVLGTYDELIIDVSGLYEANYRLKVSPEGYIRIPNVSPVKVSGLTIAAATRSIKNQVAGVFSGISTGETRINVSLGNIRSIRVSVVGEAVRPGTYTLPSLATAFNALYACGGPDSIGSMRDIKIVRGGRIIAHLDVYKFLNDGDLQNNVVLQDEDIIRIDPYKIRTFMTGAVKHPGIFEQLQGETVQDLLQYAGGFTDNAYKDKITVFRFTTKEKTVVDVEKNMFGSFKLASGDSLFVSQTTNRFDNKVDIVGSVFQPGTYALEPGLTVKQLIAKAGGVKEDAFLKVAFIKRRQANMIPENLGFDLGELLNDKLKDILLQKDDSILIKSLFDYREKQTVTILGPVQHPGTYNLIDNTTIKDLIFQAGGFKEIASKDTVELVRVIKDPVKLLTTNEKSTVQKFALDSQLNFLNGGDTLKLQNGDQVIVRSISGFEGIRTVRVEGEVIYPGSYNIKNKAERISDVILRAGGLSQYAYNAGAFLIRSERVNEIEQRLNKTMMENSKNLFENNSNNTLDANILKNTNVTPQELTQLDSIKNKLSGAQIVNKIFKTEGIVGLNIDEIMHNPGSKYDLKLEENDIIYIPREQQTVRVLGQVLFPTIVRYDNTMTLRDYIRNSGGFSNNADRTKVFVLYANGNAKSAKSFLGIKFYPKVEKGSRIIVPNKPVDLKEKISIAQTVGILTSITSTAALIYSILKK